MSDTLAAIDVGTNSLHLVVARVRDQEGFEVLESVKEMVRLGRGGGDMKQLSPDAIDRAVEALTRFRQIADAHAAPIRAVATSATREAENHAELIERARREAGVEIEVISGVEEARLIHLGVLQALPVFDHTVLLCDIGGGSTELLLGQAGEVLAARSLKMGAVRLTDRFFTGDRVRSSEVAACRSYVRSLAMGFRREIDQHGYDLAVGCSGTIEAVVHMARAAAGGPPLQTPNAATISRDDVAEVVERVLAARTTRQRSRLPGLDPKRADIITAGVLILEGVLDVTGAERLTFSGYALREGVLLDTLQRTKGGSLHHLRDVSRRSVRDLAQVWDENPVHSAHVARLALELFDATSMLHGLGEGPREYLEAAALLANVGLFIAHSQHHLHSYYVIRHAERLIGFTDGEIEIIAQVARYHRKSAPKPSHAAFAALPPEDQEVVRTLAGILRLAIGLDRSYDQRVTGLHVRRRGNVMHVLLEGAPGADLSLEVYAASARRALLEDVLGLRIAVEPAVQALQGA